LRDGPEWAYQPGESGGRAAAGGRAAGPGRPIVARSIARAHAGEQQVRRGLRAVAGAEQKDFHFSRNYGLQARRKLIPCGIFIDADPGPGAAFGIGAELPGYQPAVCSGSDEGRICVDGEPRAEDTADLDPRGAGAAFGW